ncbi:5-formyltetrahydrofolate cyclo-ligase [Bifidobacterium ramosum]|nr:5-formyltetrahydrofolate cyclo-ligase [Bifidobacterium ramosum]
MNAVTEHTTHDDSGTGGSTDKRTLRRATIARRKQVPADERARAGEQLAQAAAAITNGLTPGATVAAYVSMGSEIPTAPLLRWLLDAGYRVIVPKLGRGLDVGWGALTSLDELHAVTLDGNAAASSGPAHVDSTAHVGDPAHVGSTAAVPADRTSAPYRSSLQRPSSRRPQEPTDAATLGMDALRDAALIILPALLVDRTGTRLGRGGGWYDRALEHRRPDARTVAVCWPWEISDAPLPREPHDVPVDAILTPDGMVATNGTATTAERGGRSTD